MAAFLVVGIADVAGEGWYGWPMMVAGALTVMAVHRDLRDEDGGRG